jgi:hypothetical protein
MGREGEFLRQFQFLYFPNFLDWSGTFGKPQFAEESWGVSEFKANFLALGCWIIESLNGWSP